MPCYDSRNDASYISEQYARKINKLTRMLCSVLTNTHPMVIQGMDSEVREWWKDHQEMDRQRVKEELAAETRRKKKSKALSKLSPEERKLLNL